MSAASESAMIRICVAISPGEHRVAVVRGDALIDFAVHRPGAPDGVGSLYLGRVIARMPAMAGAFVALGYADGFLPDSEGGVAAASGLVMPVRITRAAQGGKGPRLTARVPAEDFALARRASGATLVRRGPDALHRMAALHPDAAIMIDDISLLPALRAAFGERVRLASPVFDDEIAAAVEALASPAVALPGGGRLTIQPVAALTAIDVDLGSATGDRRAKGAAQIAANRALMPVLAAQIRLRNLGGAIVVDLAGMALKRRAALGPELAACLLDDPLGARFLGFSALGLAEILRPRIYPPLHEVLAGPHAAGLAALRAVAAASAATPSWPPAMRASAAIASALQSDPGARADLAARAGRKLIVLTDHHLPTCGWRLEE